MNRDKLVSGIFTGDCCFVTMTLNDPTIFYGTFNIQLSEIGGNMV